MNYLIITLFFLSVSLSSARGEEKKFCDKTGQCKKENYPFLNLLFTESERKELQSFLNKDYHALKRREEIQERARQFFKELMKWENQRALKENNEIRKMFRNNKGGPKGMAGEKEEKEEGEEGKKERPLEELLKFLEKTT